MRRTYEIYSVLQGNQLKAKCLPVLVAFNCFSFPVICQQIYCSIQTFKVVNYSLNSHIPLKWRSPKVTQRSWASGPTILVCHYLPFPASISAVQDVLNIVFKLSFEDLLKTDVLIKIWIQKNICPIHKSSIRTAQDK